MKPNIYECKICQEHHCEHDFPEESTNELSMMFDSPPIVLHSPPVKYVQTAKLDGKIGNGHGKKEDKPSSSADNGKDESK